MAKVQAKTALTVASLLASLVFGGHSIAQDATWLANPGSGDFNAASNWNPATVPTGTAFFGTSNTTTIVFAAANSIGGFTLNAGASNYSFFTGDGTLTFTGAGVAIDGGSASFVPATFGTINFDNASTAGSATFITFNLNFNNSATAGNATISNDGALTFNNSASAGHALITNNLSLTFNNSSTAGNANIANTGGIIFQGNSSAGSATITNNHVVNLFNSATAASAHITNNATLLFNDTTTAGSAIIANNSALNFNNSSTAGNANITNTGGVLFQQNSTAGSAHISTDNQVNFNNSATAGNATIAVTPGGALNFNNTATAGNATINNNEDVNFLNSSTAGNATINNANRVQFADSSTAGNATITNQSGASVFFLLNSTAGNARLINNASGGIFDFLATTGPLGNGQVSAGSIEGGGLFLLGSNQLIVGSNNLSTTVSGVISGNGVVALDKVGTGTLALTGTNTYTGRTLVNGGTLEVDGSIATSNMVLVGIAGTGGTLSGTGVVRQAGILSGGTLAPGSAANPFGTLTSMTNLTFQSAAFYLVQVGASASNTNVFGTASLGNATVQVGVAAGAQANKTYDILHSTNIGGTSFSGVQSLTPGFTEALSYSATDVFLSLTANLGGGGGLGGNQQNIANIINNAFNSGGTLPPGFFNLFNLSGPALSNALTQVSGETATGSQQTTFDAMGQFMGLLTDPFMNRGGGVGGSPMSSGYADEANAYAAKSNPTDAFAFVKAPLAKVYDPRWSVWVSGFGGSQSTSGNVALGSNDTTSRIAGTAVGADYLFSPNTTAGFAMAGGGTNFSVANGGTGRSDLFQAGAYVRHNQGPAYISAALAYGWQDITTNRTVTVAGFDQLRAQFNANAWSGRVEGGYRFVSPATSGVGITPYAAAQFVTFDLPAYAEQAIVGTNTFALSYGAHDASDVRTELGLRADKSWAQTDGLLTLRGRFAWVHDYDPDRSIAATFQALPGASFVVNGAAQAADSALTTVSIEMKWRNGWSAAATFEGEFSNVTQSYAGKGVVRYVW